MSMEDINKEEALRAEKEGLRNYNNGNIEKALKFLEISYRLYPNNKLNDIIKECNNKLNKSSNNNNNNNNNPQSNSNQYNILNNTFISKWNKYEEKYIHPSFRPYFKGLLAVIIALVISKYLFGNTLSIGNLPGDLNYRSSNMFISAPIVTCALISFLLNAGLSLFNTRR